MQYSLFKVTSHPWLTKSAIALAIAIGVNTSLLATPRDVLATLPVYLDSQAIAAEPIELSAEAKQLIGKWQLKLKPESELPSINVVFTPEGNLYLIDPTRKSGIKAEYQINSQNGQTYLDIFDNGLGSRTTFSFNAKGQLIIQQLIFPGIMQYAFSGNSGGNFVGSILLPNLFLLTRISTDSKLDANIDFPVIPSQANRARQSEGITYVGSMNRAQQAFFLENGKFASNLVELALGISSETELYKYQVLLLDSKKGVQNIGLAKKEGLKSYTGLTYTKFNPEETTLALLCESIKPTRSFPPKFNLTNFPTCPEGYVDLNR
jgi:hypothetical protein